MGTRSRTEIFSGNRCVASIYRQMDGYPKGQGQDLFDILKDKRLVNGISSYDDKTIANGMGDLAAQIIMALKAEQPVGGIYMAPPMSEDGEMGEEFIYRISDTPGGGIVIQVTEGDMTAFGAPNDPGSFKGLFSGGVAEFGVWLETLE